jgi:hypothetical protein
MLTCLVPVLFTFYIQGVLKLKKNSGAKRLRNIGIQCSLTQREENRFRQMSYVNANAVDLTTHSHCRL